MERAEIYFYEAFAEEAERLMEYAEQAGVRAGYTPLTIQEAGHGNPPAEVVSLRTQSVLPMAWGARVKGVLSRSTGHDHLLAWRAALKAAGSAYPALGYLPQYCARAVAEQAMLLWMALLRRLPMQQAQFGEFRRDGLTGREAAGKTLAVFGVGNIGYEICWLGEALGMTVVGVELVERHADVRYVTPAEALGMADVLVCAMNLTRENRAYFTRRLLAGTRQHPVLVNIARGECTPAAEVEAALDAGDLSGAALDVFNEEATLAPALRTGQMASLTEDNQALLRLRKRENFICTPHNAFNTAEAVERKSEQSVRSFLHFRDTGEFLWPVPGAGRP